MKKTKKVEKEKKSYLAAYILVIIFVLVLVIALPSKQITCQRMTTQTVTESEPYTEVECNNIQLKFVDEWGDNDITCVNEICDRNEQYCVEKNFWGNCIRYADRCTHYACTKYRMDCELEITNIDNEYGTWRLDGYSWNRELNRQEDFIKSVGVGINPTKSSTARWSFTYSAGDQRSCWYNWNTLPTKQVCDNVIRYRDVQKTVQVQEDYKKKVHWLFGQCY